MIKAGSLASVKELMWKLGETSKSANGESKHTGLTRVVEAVKGKLDRELCKLNEQIKNDTRYVDKFHWQIQHRPAPRFWEPAPPTLVIAIPRQGKAAKKESADTKPLTGTTLQTSLACTLFNKPYDISATGDFLIDPLLEANESAWKIPSDPTSTDLPIFRGEWQAELFPAATMHPITKSSGTYDPGYILTNYLLGENEPDLDDNATLDSPLALTRAGSIYTGSTYVNQKLDDRYRVLLKQFRMMQGASVHPIQQAEEFLHDHDLLVVTLNGFNSALLQRHESIQLNPADPLGFKDYQAFATEVAETLHKSNKGVSPDPHTPFLPIRSGGLRVMSIRLVDIFGRYTELTPYDVTTAIPMEVPEHGDWVRLPPRLAQAARWNFRFLQAKASHSLIESQSHQSSSPIHGWIIPNLLDKSLDCFDPTGKSLGSIRTQTGHSVWESAGNAQITGIMKQIVDWIVSVETSSEKQSEQSENSFLDEFIEDIEEAMDNIHPDDREGQTVFSVLMGRPMAVVQLGVELELKGLPAFNSSWGELHRDLSGLERSTDRFDHVKFPYRLGEYCQRNDGLIGYWTFQESGELSTEFSVNDSVSARLNISEIEKLKQKNDALIKGNGHPEQWIDRKNAEWRIHDPQGRTLFEFLLAEEDAVIKKQDLIQPYVREGSRVWATLVEHGCLQEELPFPQIRHYAEAERLSISAAGEMQQVAALIDPHGVIHLSSGIQPVKSIQLPERFIKEALERMEISFQTAPLLTPEDQLQVSLPSDQSFTWAWREANQWSSHQNVDTHESPVIVPENSAPANTAEDDEAEIRSFKTVAFFPERCVLREGQLVLRHKKPTDETNQSAKSSDLSEEK